MSHSQHIDDEVNAPHQMRDVVVWGCAAIVSATAAISSYALQSDFKAPGLGSESASVESAIGSGRFLTGGEIAKDANEDSSVDNFTTGSVAPRSEDKVKSTATGNNSVSSFGMTVASKQSNADTIRRMQTELNAPANENTVLTVLGDEIGNSAVGIDLGTGHSFSVLGKRYSALVNAAPTLFEKLTARASIVEHESSIEAHLVAGPLKDVKAAKLLCERIQLRINTTCQPTKFTGRTLKLY